MVGIQMVTKDLTTMLGFFMPIVNPYAVLPFRVVECMIAGMSVEGPLLKWQGICARRRNQGG